MPRGPVPVPEQYALAEEMGVPAEEVAAAIAKVGKNGDGTLCFKFFKSGGPNIIDNRSAHE
jgi:Ca2+-binding EF-hand superfamily protein